MKKKIIGIIVIISLVAILAITAKGLGYFSTTSTVINGGTYVCGNYYQSPAPLDEIKDYCETQDFICDVEFYKTGSFGDIYSIQCQKLCTICDDQKDNFWGELALYAESRDSCASETVSRSDAVKYYEGSLSESQILDAYCGEPEPEPQQVTCYACDNGRVTSKIFLEQCGSGYETSSSGLNCEVTPPPPPVEEVTCYTCSGGNVEANQFDFCPSGWTETQPTSCAVQNTVTCHTCDGTTAKQVTLLEDSCPEHLSATPLNCQQEVKTCWFCDGTNVQVSQHQNQCPSGQEDYPLDGTIPKCGFESLIKQYFDFEDKPGESAILLIAIGLLLYAVITTIADARNGNNGGGF